MTWQRINGYDWCILEAPGAEPFIGLTIGYGLVHEPIEAFGTLQLLAGMVQSELSRPIETAPGQVAVPGVWVAAGTDTLDIGIRGEHRAVLATWQRLVEIFAGQHPLDPAQPVGLRVNAAPRDLASRFGVTSLTLGAAEGLGVQISHDPMRLLRHLNPVAGKVRAVVCTNSTQLAGSGLIPPLFVPPSHPEPSRYCTATAGSGWMQYPGGQAIMSTVVPRTANGAAAIRVLVQQTAQQLGSLTQSDDGVTASLISVGPDMFATIMASETSLATPQQRRQVQGLLASRPVADHQVQEATEWEAAHPSLSRTLERRVHGLADDVPVSIAGTQQALAAARSTLRFFIDHGATPPIGFEEQTPSELPAPQGRQFGFKTGGRERITIGSQVIEHYRPASRTTIEECSRVDLTRLGLVIEDPNDCVVLLDNEFRVVEVIFDTFRQERQLREVIAAHTAGVPRVIAHHAVHVAPVRQRIQHRRRLMRWGVLTPLVVLLSLATSSWVAGSSSSKKPELEVGPHPYEVDVGIGETAATLNGSRVTVHDVTHRQVDLGTETIVAVEYCAAEDHELVNPGSFRVLYGPYSHVATPVEAAEDALAFDRLDAGQCVTGNAGFFIPDDDDPAEVIIEYRPGDLSSITWIMSHR